MCWYWCVGCFGTLGWGDWSSAYAQVLARVRKVGSGMETADARIAAVAMANGFSIAARDTSPLVAAGLNVIDPWAA